MVKLYEGGAFLVNGCEIVEDNAEAAAKIGSFVGEDRVLSKEEAKMLRKKFPGVHMVTTVNKTMVDELPYVLQALPNNYFAQEALAEMQRDKHHAGIVNTRGDVNA